MRHGRSSDAGHVRKLGALESAFKVRPGTLRAPHRAGTASGLGFLPRIGCCCIRPVRFVQQPGRGSRCNVPVEAQRQLEERSVARDFGRRARGRSRASGNVAFTNRFRLHAHFRLRASACRCRQRAARERKTIELVRFLLQTLGKRPFSCRRCCSHDVPR